MDEAIQSVLFIGKECQVFKLPPRTSSSGYKAAEWESSLLWTGRLRVIENLNSESQGSGTCEIRMEDGQTGELFATAPYDGPKGKSVEPVLDSSRYFVLAVVDPSNGRRAFLGMGFPERSDAFDFQVALQEWTRRKENTEEPSSTEPSPHAPNESKAKDFSLKDNETISISIGGRSSKPRQKPAATSGGAIPFLPPPPSAKDVRGR